MVSVPSPAMAEATIEQLVRREAARTPVVEAIADSPLESPYSAISTPRMRGSAAFTARSSSRASSTLRSAGNWARSSRYRSRSTGSTPSGDTRPRNSSTVPKAALSRASARVSATMESSSEAA